MSPKRVKRIKKYLIAVLAAALVFLMCSCGPDTAGSAGTPSGSGSSASQNAGPAAPASSQDKPGAGNADKNADDAQASSKSEAPVLEEVPAKEESSGNGTGSEENSDTAAAESSEGAQEPEGSGDGNETENDAGAVLQPAAPAGHYDVPPFRDAVYDGNAAIGNDEVGVDLSSCGQGYVAIFCAPTGTKIKFQVMKDGITTTYSVVTGIPQIFPLQYGDGHYAFRVMKNIEDNMYAELFSCDADVYLGDPFDPFLRPNQYCNYDQGSSCVQLASEMAAGSSSQEEFISKVFDYVVTNVTYDVAKAATVASGYLPSPDSTLAEGKGICLDYASLTAAMMRSQGVPTQMIFGYVAPDDLYHAWNKFYTPADGWVLAEFTVSGNQWNRIDLTFYSGGAAAEYIGDGSNYMEADVF